MEEFLIKDYTGIDIDKRESSEVSIVDEKRLWEILQKAKSLDGFPQISVYKLGECVLDWS